MTVKSVYNFVSAPKEDEVFKPDWAEQVSHDIPFSDGESGEIELKITAESPIFIRNGHAEDQEENEFSHFMDENGEKKYFIPATSLKGMFRNVLEIMSDSRLNTSDDIFAFRNLKHDSYVNRVMKNKNIKSGWIKRIGGEWVIQECDNKRIPIESLESKFDVELKGRSAIEKYENLKKKDLNINCWFVKNLGRKTRDRFIETGKLYSFESNDNHQFEGEVVVYGSMANKKYEYVFGEGYGENYKVSTDLMKRFVEIETKNENSLWKYFDKNGKQNRPVFFSLTNNQIEHFGFSRLYKLPTVNRIHELEPIKSYPNTNMDFDLASTIFGTTLKTNQYKSKALSHKGRVFFGNAECNESVGANKSPVTAVLSSPKASYFPYYLQERKSYLDDDAVLSGFKKYPHHRTIKESDLNIDNSNIQSTFNPLGTGTVFVSKIRFHNLKKVEIGALLSAISFHGYSDTFSHSLGAAKPLGYGKIKVEIKEMKFLSEKLEYYLELYEDQMERHKSNWFKSDRMLQFLTMAKSEVSESEDEFLKYPQLEPRNEFLEYQDIGLPQLEKHSLVGVKSIKIRNKPQEVLFLTEFETFQKTKKYLNQLIKDWGEFSDQNKKVIYEKLVTIYKSKHRVSVKEMYKDYDRMNTIPRWIGDESTQKLYDEFK